MMQVSDGAVGRHVGIVCRFVDLESMYYIMI